MSLVTTYFSPIVVVNATVKHTDTHSTRIPPTFGANAPMPPGWPIADWPWPPGSSPKSTTTGAPIQVISSSSTSSSTSVPVILGIVIGLLVAVAFVVGGLLWTKSKRQERRRQLTSKQQERNSNPEYVLRFLNEEDFEPEKSEMGIGRSQQQRASHATTLA